MERENQRRSFKDFSQAAQQLASHVARDIAGLPKRRSSDIVANRVLRAAPSIPANIANEDHLSLLKGPASETESGLDDLAQLGAIEEERGREMEGMHARLSRALSRRIQALEQQEQQRRLPEGGLIYDTGANLAAWSSDPLVSSAEEGEVSR